MKVLFSGPLNHEAWTARGPSAWGAQEYVASMSHNFFFSKGFLATLIVFFFLLGGCATGICLSSDDIIKHHASAKHYVQCSFVFLPVVSDWLWGSGLGLPDFIHCSQMCINKSSLINKSFQQKITFVVAQMNNTDTLHNRVRSIKFNTYLKIPRRRYTSCTKLIYVPHFSSFYGSLIINV